MTDNAIDRSHLLDWGRCLKCRYPLKGLTSNHCPECGHSFDSNDPTTMWIPRPAGAFTRRLAKPADRITTWIPAIATLSILWGARLPNGASPSTVCGLLIWIALLAGHLPVITMRIILNRMGRMPWSTVWIDKKFERRALFMLIVSIVLLWIPIPARVGFMLSRTAFERATAEILAEPFNQKPSAPRWIGIYHVKYIDRCPHGIEFTIQSVDLPILNYHAEADFIYKNEPGNCVNHDETGESLGGDWYLPK